MQKIWTPQLTKILPENILSDAKLRAAAEALDAELSNLSSATREVLHLPRLDELSGRILDYLAEQFHCDFYEPLYLDETEKKNLIRESIAWHRIKGTVSAAEKISAWAFREAAIEEWFEYDGGEPYHFRITSKGYKQTPDGLETFLRMIDAAKNVRSWLDKIIVDYSPTEPTKFYVGQAEAHVGIKTISLPLLPNERTKIHAGAALVFNGFRGGTELALPRILIDNKIKRTVGQALVKRGEIYIDANPDDLPKYDNIIESGIADLLIADVGIARPGEIKMLRETYEQSYRVNVFTGGSLYRQGVGAVNLNKPRDERRKIFVGHGLGKIGEIKIDQTPEIRKRAFTTIHAGATLYKAGNVTIDTVTQPTIPDDKRFYATTKKIPLNVAGVIGKFGTERIGLGTQRWRDVHKVIMHAGAALIKSGQLTIGVADENFFDAPEGEWLKLWFKFPSGTSKIIYLQNPRDDLTKTMIRQVGDIAVADKVLKINGEVTTGISRAALITKFTKKLF